MEKRPFELTIPSSPSPLSAHDSIESACAAARAYLEPWIQRGGRITTQHHPRGALCVVVDSTGNAQCIIRKAAP